MGKAPGRRPGVPKSGAPFRAVERHEEYEHVRFEILECGHVDRRWAAEGKSQKRRCPVCAEDAPQSAIRAHEAFVDEMLELRLKAQRDLL